jgi:pSer/pThr/pTyr-binding forkhead associated (FHA) protein
MIVKLRILHGKLQNKHGGQLGQDVKVRGPKFVIGSDPDCSMYCRSSTVSPHHCEIRQESRGPVIRDLYSESGTFLNDQRVDNEVVLQAGDLLRIGRLEFEIVIQESTEEQHSAAEKSKDDPVADYISDLLVEADEEDRVRRLEDPESRHFHPSAEEAPAASAEESAELEKKRKKPEKKKPGKLPPPPPMTADNTVEAAEETLKKLFSKDKR